MRLLHAFTQIRRLPEIGASAKLLREWLPLTLAYGGALGWHPGQSVRMRDGKGRLALETDADVATFWSIFFAEPYPVLPSDRFIIDAGANIGAFALYAARAAPEAQILAIEPFPSTFARLEQVASQPWTGNRILCIQGALAGRDGQGTIESEPNIGSQFRRMATVSGKENGLPVSAISLETLMERHGIDQLDLLKLDIEGSEFDVILNTGPEILRRISRVCLEYHPQPVTGNTPDLLIARLRNAGLDLVKQSDHGMGYGILRFSRL